MSHKKTDRKTLVTRIFCGTLAALMLFGTAYTMIAILLQ